MSALHPLSSGVTDGMLTRALVSSMVAELPSQPSAREFISVLVLSLGMYQVSVIRMQFIVQSNAGFVGLAFHCA